MPGVVGPPVNLTCSALLSMALPMRSTFMSLTSPYRSRGSLLSWCPQDSVQVHPGKCRALACEVNELLMFPQAELADLLGDITYILW